MNIDDAKRAWRDEWSQEPLEFAAIVSTVRTAERFRSKVFRRDLLETAAALLVIGALSPALFLFKDWLPWLGIWAILLGAFEIVVVLHWTRLHIGETPVDAPLKVYFQRERQRVDTQIWLMRNVGWWYCAPIVIGVCMFWVGLLLPFVVAAIVACLVFVAFGGWIHTVNLRFVHRDLIPLRQTLAEAERAFEE
jgi:hypothetical protein